MVIFIKQFLTETKKIWEDCLKDGFNKDTIGEFISNNINTDDIINSKALEEMANNLVMSSMLNNLGFEVTPSDTSAYKIMNLEVLKEKIKESLDGASNTITNDLFCYPHGFAALNEKGRVHFLNLSLKDNKENQERFHELLSLIGIALEKDNLEGYKQLYEKWNNKEEYNDENDYDGSLATLELFLKLNDSIEELKNGYPVEIERILNNSELESMELADQFFKVREEVKTLEIVQGERKVKDIQSKIRECLIETKKEWESYLQSTDDEDKQRKNYLLYLILKDKPKKQEKFNEVLKWINEALVVDTWEGYEKLSWKWNDNSDEYKIKNDYDHSLFELKNLLKEGKDCTLFQLKELREFLGLESTNHLSTGWEIQLNDKLVDLKSQLGLESLEVEKLNKKLGQSKLSDIPTSDNLETILKKNENLETNLQNRIVSMESKFEEMAENLEQKTIEKKELESSLAKAKKKLTELEELSQEKNQLVEEMKEMTVSQEKLNQSLAETEKELTKTSLEMIEVKEKIEQLEKELEEKELEVNHFRSSFERILTMETEDYQTLIQSPPRTPQFPKKS